MPEERDGGRRNRKQRKERWGGSMKEHVTMNISHLV